MTNGTADCLLNIAKKNVITNDTENDDEIENKSQTIKTRVFSDCFVPIMLKFNKRGYLS